jgi:hypothetical protein
VTAPAAEPTDRVQILEAELYGWTVRVWRRLDAAGRWDGTLTPPDAALSAFAVCLWPSLAGLTESLAAFLGPRVRLAPAYVRSVLTALMDVETAP